MEYLNQVHTNEKDWKAKYFKKYVYFDIECEKSKLMNVYSKTWYTFIIHHQ